MQHFPTIWGAAIDDGWRHSRPDHAPTLACPTCTCKRAAICVGTRRSCRMRSPNQESWGWTATRGLRAVRSSTSILGDSRRRPASPSGPAHTRPGSHRPSPVRSAGLRQRARAYLSLSGWLSSASIAQTMRNARDLRGLARQLSRRRSGKPQTPRRRSLHPRQAASPCCDPGVATCTWCQAHCSIAHWAAAVQRVHRATPAMAAPGAKN